MDIVNISRNDLVRQDRRSLGSLTFIGNGNARNNSRAVTILGNVWKEDDFSLIIRGSLISVDGLSLSKVDLSD